MKRSIHPSYSPHLFLTDLFKSQSVVVVSWWPLVNCGALWWGLPLHETWRWTVKHPLYLLLCLKHYVSPFDINYFSSSSNSLGPFLNAQKTKKHREKLHTVPLFTVLSTPHVVFWLIFLKFLHVHKCVLCLCVYTLVSGGQKVMFTLFETRTVIRMEGTTVPHLAD